MRLGMITGKEVEGGGGQYFKIPLYEELQQSGVLGFLVSFANQAPIVHDCTVGYNEFDFF